MNDPKEIVERVLIEHYNKGPHKRHRCKLCFCYWDDDAPAFHTAQCGFSAIADAIHVERDKVTAFQSGISDNLTCGACAETVFCGSTMHSHDSDCVYTELERVKAERDEAVRLLEPMVEAAKRYTDYTPNNNLPAWVGLTLGHCRAARAFVEKVKRA